MDGKFLDKQLRLFSVGFAMFEGVCDSVDTERGNHVTRVLNKVFFKIAVSLLKS